MSTANSGNSSNKLSLGTVGLLVVALLAVLALVATSLAPQPVSLPTQQQQQQQQGAGTTTTTAGPRLPANWVVVGTGLAAATLVYRLPRSWRGSVTLREATGRVGGRVLSTTPLASPVSTITAPQEFGGWGFHFLRHPLVSALMADLRHQVIPVQLLTPYTFRWSAAQGKQPYGVLPPQPAGGYAPGTTYAAVAAADPFLWFAHTGIWVEDAPTVSAAVVAALDAPIHVDVPVGMGWQGIVLSGLGVAPVLYGRRLVALHQQLDGPHGPELQLQYASGDVDYLRPPDTGAVLTLSVSDMMQVRGLPPAVAQALRESFVVLRHTGVLYLVWNAVDTWAPQLGFTEGMVATDTPLGAIVAVQSNVLRCNSTRARDAGYWSDLIVNQGDAAAKQAAAAQLSAVFGVRVPLPASVAFQGWAHNFAMWQAAADVPAVQAAVAKELATAFCVPVRWANADISTLQGTLEGAVASASLVAAEIIAGTTAG